MMTGSILIQSLSTCCRYIPSCFLPLPLKSEGDKKTNLEIEQALRTLSSSIPQLPSRKLRREAVCDWWPLRKEVSL